MPVLEWTDHVGYSHTTLIYSLYFFLIAAPSHWCHGQFGAASCFKWGRGTNFYYGWTIMSEKCTSDVWVGNFTAPCIYSMLLRQHVANNWMGKPWLCSSCKAVNMYLQEVDWPGIHAFPCRVTMWEPGIWCAGVSQARTCAVGRGAWPGTKNSAHGYYFLLPYFLHI